MKRPTRYLLVDYMTLVSVRQGTSPQAPSFEPNHFELTAAGSGSFNVCPPPKILRDWSLPLLYANVRGFLYTIAEGIQKIYANSRFKRRFPKVNVYAAEADSDDHQFRVSG